MLSIDWTGRFGRRISDSSLSSDTDNVRSIVTESVSCSHCSRAALTIWINSGSNASSSAASDNWRFASDSVSGSLAGGVTTTGRLITTVTNHLRNTTPHQQVRHPIGDVARNRPGGHPSPPLLEPDHYTRQMPPAARSVDSDSGGESRDNRAVAA